MLDVTGFQVAIEIIEHQLTGDAVPELLQVALELETTGKKRVTVVRAITAKLDALETSTQEPPASAPKDEF